MKQNILRCKMSIFLTLFLAIGSFNFAQAEDGSPEAKEFSRVLVRVASYLNSQRDIAPKVSRRKMSKAAEQIEKSLSATSKESLIEISPVRPVNDLGVPKVALFESKPPSVVLHDRSWNRLSDKDRVILAFTGLLVFAGTEDDQSVEFETLIGSRYREILGIPLSSRPPRRLPPYMPGTIIYSVNFKWEMGLLTRDANFLVGEIVGSVEYSTDGKYCEFVIGDSDPVTCSHQLIKKNAWGMLNFTSVGQWVEPKMIVDLFTRNNIVAPSGEGREWLNGGLGYEKKPELLDAALSILENDPVYLPEEHSAYPPGKSYFSFGLYGNYQLSSSSNGSWFYTEVRPLLKVRSNYNHIGEVVIKQNYSREKEIFE
jgi:hypothetical protein